MKKTLITIFLGIFITFATLGVTIGGMYLFMGNTSNAKVTNENILNEGLAFQDIYKQSNRKHCATLPYKGILKALEEYENK